MSTAFLGENIIAEPQNILLKRIHKLDGKLHLNPLQLVLYINRVVDGILSIINLLHISCQPLRFMKRNRLLLPRPPVLISNRQSGI